MSEPLFSATDHQHMAHALRLAARGTFTTRPNPQVGCVLAQGDEVVGSGWHQRAGQPHAEVLALRDAGDRAKGAVAYVSLEPCAHHGRTPPCADALIAAGVARVVVAQTDPFEQVAGKGLQALQKAGIRVDTGLMRDAAREQIRGFLSRIERGRPWLRVKLACSLDGRTALASGESKWISSAAARDDVQRWRARSDAILTGAGTLRADDPSLTARVDQPVEPPLRVVLGGKGSVFAQAKLWSDGLAPVLMIRSSGSAARLPPGVDCLEIASDGAGYPDLAAALSALAARGVGEVQLEAGSVLAGAFLCSGLVDELLIYQAPVLLGDRGRALFADLDFADMRQRLGFETLDLRRIGPDLRMLLRPVGL